MAEIRRTDHEGQASGRGRRVAGLAALGIAFVLLATGLALVAAGVAGGSVDPAPTVQSSP